MMAGYDHTILCLDEFKKCIFRVPKVLLKQNPDAYTPSAASIGPFHHHENKSKKATQFQIVEQMKKRYRNEVCTLLQVTLEELTEKITYPSDTEFEKNARAFYAEPLTSIQSKEFIQMMILDGCFVIQLFRKCYNKKLVGSYDPLFHMDCMFHFLCHDLLLLENQLPWFVLEAIYNLIPAFPPSQSLPLPILILQVFKTLPSLKHNCESYINFLSDPAVLPHKYTFRGHHHGSTEALHILDLMRDSIVFPIKKYAPSLNPCPDDHNDMHNATALSKAGIKFKCFESADSILHIKFKKSSLLAFWKNGVIEIPKLNVGMVSESLFRNLIALEQCYHGYLGHEITSYAIFMDNLITSKEDMDLLCNAKVIGNWLSEEEGCKFFSNLYKAIPHTKFYYSDLCKEIQERIDIKWYTYMTSFKTEKLSSPWAKIAFVLFVFTLVLQIWNSINSLRTFARVNNGF